MSSTQGIRAGRAFVELFTDDSKLVRGLRKAQKRIKAFGDRIRNLGLQFAGIGTAMLTPMLGAAKVFSSFGDQVAKMAKRTGLSVGTLSELRFVASQTGTEFESLEMGFRRMQRSIYDAGRGMSTVVDALTDLGLRFEDLDGLSPEDQFKLLGEAISKIADPTKKAAIAMTLFGRTGTNLLPMFARGAKGITELQEEARRLGLTMSAEDAKAAEDFTDALDKLWKVVKMGVFRVGAALAPTLQALADTITNVAVTINTWIDQNRQLLVTVMQVAATVLAGGIALIAFGAIISSLGTAVGGLVSIVTGIAGVFNLLAGVIVAMVSPIGLVVTAIAALGTYLVYASGVGGKALTWLGEKFNALKGVALTAYRGIADALAAGDISLAAKILWLTLKAEWTRGVNFLEKIWLDFSNFFLRIGHDTWHGLLASVETVWHALEVGWLETVSFLSNIWTSFTGIFSRTWENMKAYASKAWTWIKGLFDDSTAESRDAVYAKIDEERQAAISKIDTAQQQELAQRDADRQRKREESARIHEATLAEIGNQNLRKHSELDTEYEQRMAENEADLKQARDEWRQAIEQAREQRVESEADPAPERLDDAKSIIDQANQALEGMGDLLSTQVAKIGSRGTFLASNVLGLQAGGVSDRMANGIDKIERNTRSLRNAQELSFT